MCKAIQSRLGKDVDILGQRTLQKIAQKVFAFFVVSREHPSQVGTEELQNIDGYGE